MIHYPLTVLIDREVWKDRTIWSEQHSWYRYRNWRVVERDMDMDRVWIAPRWIAWLYRALPNHVNVNFVRWKQDPSWYLACISAPLWCVGIRMGSRQRHIPAIAVSWGDAWNHTYLPWGTRLYAKLLGYS